MTWQAATGCSSATILSAMQRVFCIASASASWHLDSSFSLTKAGFLRVHSAWSCL